MPPPAFDDQTHLKTLLAIREGWLRADTPPSKAGLAKLDAAVKARLRPNRQTPVAKDTPTSELLDIVTRFKTHQKRRPFNFSDSDRKYLRRVRKMARRRTQPTTDHALLKSRLSKTRPALGKHTRMATLEHLRQELIKKKVRFPAEWKDDEREYLKKVKSLMAIKRRRATLNALADPKRTGMTEAQEERLSKTYYGEGGEAPVTMGTNVLYAMMRGADKQDMPSKRAVASWVRRQKLQQVYGPRRLEGQGDVSSFKPIAPMAALSMDLANYQRGAKAREQKVQFDRGKSADAPMRLPVAN